MARDRWTLHISQEWDRPLRPLLLFYILMTWHGTSTVTAHLAVFHGFLPLCLCAFSLLFPPNHSQGPRGLTTYDLSFNRIQTSP
jgi:hypothetical protein